MANAKTQIALTAASIPTATPLPPTAVPTPIPVQPTVVIEEPAAVPPTQPLVLAPTAAVPSGSTGTDSEENECAGPLSNMKGPHIGVTFKNTTSGNLSLYLYQVFRLNSERFPRFGKPAQIQIRRTG
jgi:hypothetical protein